MQSSMQSKAESQSRMASEIGFHDSDFMTHATSVGRDSSMRSSNAGSSASAIESQFSMRSSFAGSSASAIESTIESTVDGEEHTEVEMTSHFDSIADIGGESGGK